MRKPRDFDSALRALTDKTKALKETKRHQLGDLVMATGAGGLDMETLAGGLLAMVETSDTLQKENWRKRGAAFFRGKPSPPQGRDRGNAERNQASDGAKTSA
jgi:Conjugal transfer protein TraD